MQTLGPDGGENSQEVWIIVRDMGFEVKLEFEYWLYYLQLHEFGQVNNSPPQFAHL